MMSRFSTKSLCLSAILAAAWPVAAIADTVVVGNLTYNNVRIVSVHGEDIVFTTSTGRDVMKPIAQVPRIQVEGEAALNEAEDAYAAQQWDKAATAYDKVVRSTQKPWLRDWASRRLLEASNKAGRFDAVVKEFIALAKKDPAAAKGMTLNMPPAKSAYLTDAAKLLKDEAAAAEKTESREVLLNALVAVYRAKGDAAGAEEAARELAQLRIRANPNSPEAQRAAAQLVLVTASKQLSEKDYAKAIATLEQSASKIVEPAQVADALWCIAECKAGQAAAGTDAAAWKEAALAYMRVIANAPRGNPRIPQAMLKAASIHADKLSDPAGAVELYKGFVEEFPSHESVAEAKAAIAKLDKKP